MVSPLSLHDALPIFEFVSCRVVAVEVGWRTFSTSQLLCELLFRPVPVKNAFQYRMPDVLNSAVVVFPVPLTTEPPPAAVPLVSLVQSDELAYHLKATVPVALAGVTSA